MVGRRRRQASPPGQPEPFDPGADPGEDRRHQRHRRHRPGRQFAEDPGVDHQEAGQREEYGGARDEDRPAGGRHRRRHRRRRVGRPRQLLPEAGDDEEGVVDADADPDHRRDVRHEQVELGERGGRSQEAEGDDHPGQRQQQRQPGGDDRAGGDEQDRQRQRQPELLGPGQVLPLLLDQVGDQGRAAGDVDADPRRRPRDGRLGDPGGDRLPFGVGAADGGERRGDAAVGGDQPLDAGVERADDADHPRHCLDRVERGGDDLLVGGLLGDQGLRFEDDQDLLGRGLVEPGVEDLLGPLGVGAGDAERGAGQVRLEPGQEDRADGDGNQPGRDGQAVAARQERAEGVEAGGPGDPSSRASPRRLVHVDSPSGGARRPPAVVARRGRRPAAPIPRPAALTPRCPVA
ncbi:MAG: hypothetical protein AVDCRST_MAG59-1349 [uncultured Thermomicrobiales bacterium]|uniref:Uncharacterized protein n=1 Tax=uncultured Thermomicrobiales bacterium TaxID=1645740 RepID=A0A6J4UDX4_9BACT|nr:MAG: hypothetical protein AVDCRST_MAG59-1349 [uncultured Thermomicrobiales bacterium]